MKTFDWQNKMKKLNDNTQTIRNQAERTAAGVGGIILFFF